MTDAVRAGALYAAIAFAAGFVLGAIRVLVALPLLGELLAVLLEIPIMLCLSWIACAWSVRRFAVPAKSTARLAMGMVAFALLMAAEAALSILGMGISPGQYLATYRNTAAQLGLLAQIAFATFPLLQAWLRRA